MIRKARNENFSREEKEFVVRYVNENWTILENRSNTAEVFLKKRDKWRDLTEKLKAFGVVRDWKEVRHAYQRWKWFAKKNIVTFKKWGDNLPTIMSPTEFDYMIYNMCSQNFEDEESSFLNEFENNLVANEYDELLNIPHSLIATNSESCNVPRENQFAENSTECTNEISDKIKVEPQNDGNIEDSNNKLKDIEDSPDAYEEIRNNTYCVQSTNVPVNSTDIVDASRESLSSDIEPVHKKQKISSSNVCEFNNGISNNIVNDNKFKRQENILKLKILRAQLNREKEESKIRIKQEKIKLNILKIQLKRERILLKNMQNSS